MFNAKLLTAQLRRVSSRDPPAVEADNSKETLALAGSLRDKGGSETEREEDVEYIEGDLGETTGGRQASAVRLWLSFSLKRRRASFSLCTRIFQSLHSRTVNIRTRKIRVSSQLA